MLMIGFNPITANILVWIVINPDFREMYYKRDLKNFYRLCDQNVIKFDKPKYRSIDAEGVDIMAHKECLNSNSFCKMYYEKCFLKNSKDQIC